MYTNSNHSLTLFSKIEYSTNVFNHPSDVQISIKRNNIYVNLYISNFILLKREQLICIVIRCMYITAP